MASPAEAVLETYELLEAILSYVPFRDLFVLQGVNTIWSTMIQRSAILQMKMFLLPDGKPLMPVTYPRAITPARDWAEYFAAPAYGARLELCPALTVECFVCCRVLRRGTGIYGLDIRNPFGLEDYGFVFVNSISLNKMRQRDTCKEKGPVPGNLLLSQPPIKTIKYVANEQYTICSVHNPHGLRLEDLTAVHEKIYEKEWGDDEQSVMHVNNTCTRVRNVPSAERDKMCDACFDLRFLEGL